METNMLIRISPEQLSEMIISGIREELQSSSRFREKSLITKT